VPFSTLLEPFNQGITLMLPFLKKKQEGSMSAPVESIEREHDEGAEFDVLESAAEDLISAVHAKDVKGVAMAMRAAFELMESEPHKEGEHT
jgi:hypothetical protein